MIVLGLRLHTSCFFALPDLIGNTEHSIYSSLSFLFFWMQTSGLWRMLQCIQTAIISLRFIIIMPLFLWFAFLYLLSGPWFTAITLFHYFHKICVHYLLGERKNQKNLTRLSFFQVLYLRPQHFFHTYNWDGVFLTCHLQMCTWEFLVFSFFSGNFE